MDLVEPSCNFCCSETHELFVLLTQENQQGIKQKCVGKDHHSSIASSSPPSFSSSFSSIALWPARMAARAPTPPLFANGLAYCFSHSSDSQTEIEIVSHRCITQARAKEVSRWNSPALFPATAAVNFCGRARLTRRRRPRSSFKSMLSIAS